MSIKDSLHGFPMANDRLFKIDTGDFTAYITEYNDELTGFDPRLCELDPNTFEYGGNAYYITTTYARAKGWYVTEVKE